MPSAEKRIIDENYNHLTFLAAAKGDRHKAYLAVFEKVIYPVIEHTHSHIPKEKLKPWAINFAESYYDSLTKLEAIIRADGDYCDDAHNFWENQLRDSYLILSASGAFSYIKSEKDILTVSQEQVMDMTHKEAVVLMGMMIKRCLNLGSKFLNLELRVYMELANEWKVLRTKEPFKNFITADKWQNYLKLRPVLPRSESETDRHK